MNVLLADPDKNFVEKVLDSWSLTDSPLAAVTKASDLISWIKEEEVGLCFLSTEFFTVHDLDVISFLKEHQPGVDVVVLCNSKNIQIAENALSRGASSYLLKPLSPSVLEHSARKIQQKQSNRKSYRLMEDHVLEDLLGNTPAMKKILRTLYKVAPTSSTILVTGESGTGKEFVSNIIHRLSKRADEPFVTVNCGAIPENIVESELFGVRKGAFTGAIANKKGLFEEAEGGTLFLDEIGELSLSTQVKILRFLQEKEIRRVGETENRYLDVRIIAATNKNLEQAIIDGEFREDLYYRLNTFQFTLPPLRERRKTIPKLVKFFILKYQKETGRIISQITPSAQIALSTWDYPGNIRELENIIEHAVVLADDETIRVEDFPDYMQEVIAPKALLPSKIETLAISQDADKVDDCCTDFAINEESIAQQEKQRSPIYQQANAELLSLQELEKLHIIYALEALEYNQTEVAKKLGISRSTLWRKLQEHKIKIDN